MIDFKFKGLIVLLALLLSCTGYVQPAPYSGYPANGQNNQAYYNPLPSTGAPRDNLNYDQRKASDSDRETTLSRAKQGDSCEDKSESHECYSLCKDMYKRVEDKEECWELNPDKIEGMHDVWRALETGRPSQLEDISAENLDYFLNLSIAGFDFLIREYRRTKAENVLVWIAENTKVAEVMRDEDRDFETLEGLLSLVVRFDLDTVENPFTYDINRNTLFEYAISTGNDVAMDYFLDYFFQTHKSCRKTNKISVGCLTVVCKIGFAIDERDRADILDSHIFSEFMKKIIKNRINGAASADGQKWIKGAGNNKIDKISDIDDTWADEEWNPDDLSKPVCGGLL